MQKRRVYVETTIPSFYHETRPDPEIVARRTWTRQWWSTANEKYDLATSVGVLNELNNGPPDRSQEWLDLLAGLPLLPVSPAVMDVVDIYVSRRLMPNDPLGDALHVALASFHKCDFLVTWNCRHLANANKFAHLRRLNAILGLFTPALVTPLELLGGEDG